MSSQIFQTEKAIDFVFLEHHRCWTIRLRVCRWTSTARLQRPACRTIDHGVQTFVGFQHV